MVDVVLNLLYGTTQNLTLTAHEQLCVVGCACLLVLLCFGFVSVAFYKLMLYIFKF